VRARADIRNGFSELSLLLGDLANSKGIILHLALLKF